MNNLALFYIAGVLSPIILALLAKAIKRLPRDAKDYLISLSLFIRG
jgi:hypothetical protein